ncbi:MAG TPA: glutamyl-tRNA reductase [Candidatus Dormibacteraeota bacterium]|nr:glutamyl-tRNA reductase [Candidatus Dormibacteraeota bacterium]
MHLLVEGLSHRAAPLAVRERVFIPGEGLRRWLVRLSDQPHVRGGAILSTCNRTEIYVCVDDPATSLNAFTEAIDPMGEWPKYHFRLNGNAALEHLFRVASGMDSAILGEGQVLGQFKAAHRASRETCAMDPDLDFVMRRAISVAKRVRTETGIGRNPVGFGHAAVAQARAVLGPLSGRSALLVGAGKMAGVTARLLAADGLERVFFSTRTSARANELAQEMPERVVALTVPFSRVEQVAAEVDLVVCSTSSPDHIFTAGTVSDLMRRRDGRPLFMLDLAVPRDIDPAVAGVPGAHLFNVDDLAATVERGLTERAAELPAAAAILKDELLRTEMELTQHRAAPTISMLVSEVERRRAEHFRRNSPADLSDAQLGEVDRLTRALTARLLHGPIAYLREHPGDAATAMLVRDLFQLDEDGEAAEAAS